MFNPLDTIESWFETSGESDGSAYLVRGRKNLKQFMNSGWFPVRIDMVWEYETDQPTGLPEEDTLREMMEVDMTLMEVFEKDFQAILAGSYMSEGQREWYWYTRDEEEFMSRINKTLSGFGELPLDFFKEEDKNWKEYRDLMAAFGMGIGG